MHPNEALITRLYESLQDRGPDAMASCYHPDATFSDPVFPHLEGQDIAAMWRMLCAGADDLRVEFDGIEADDHTGKAHLQATYTYPPTRRRIHNVIDARFVFQDGSIIRHEDRFGLWRWTRMAFGPIGTLLGWTPPMKKKIRKTAAKALQRFKTKHSRQNP